MHSIRRLSFVGKAMDKDDSMMASQEQLTLFKVEPHRLKYLGASHLLCPSCCERYLDDPEDGQHFLGYSCICGWRSLKHKIISL